MTVTEPSSSSLAARTRFKLGRRALICGAAVAVLTISAGIAWSQFSWEPKLMAAPVSNVIPSGTYDFTYHEQLTTKTDGAGLNMYGTGRINTTPGACELNASTTATYRDGTTATFKAIRPAAGPTYVSSDDKDMAEYGWLDARAGSLFARTQLSLFPVMFLGTFTDSYSSYCSLTALGATSDPDSKPGQYKWSDKGSQALFDEGKDAPIAEMYSGLGIAEPKYSVLTRTMSSMGSGRPGFQGGFTVATDETNGVVTVSGWSGKGRQLRVEIVLTPTSAKVNSAKPKGARTARELFQDEAKRVGGGEKWFEQF